MSQGKLWKAGWGTAFVNTLYPLAPLDGATSFPRGRPGHVIVRSDSGQNVDGWVKPIDHVLTGLNRWPPRGVQADPTGWDGATGVSEFLVWCWQGNLLRFYPDRNVGGTFVDCLLEEPGPDMSPPDLDPGAYRSFRMTFVRMDGVAWVGY